MYSFIFHFTTITFFALSLSLFSNIRSDVTPTTTDDARTAAIEVGGGHCGGGGGGGGGGFGVGGRCRISTSRPHLPVGRSVDVHRRHAGRAVSETFDVYHQP